MNFGHNKKFKMKERYNKINVIRISKKLSYLLRHDKDTPMDKNGWVDVIGLLKKLDVSKSLLDEVVETNNKKRFSYNDDETKIRANQGHSLGVDVELEEKIPPVVLFHGTSPNFIKSILKNGLSKMNRQHVHLSSDVNTALTVGKRHSKRYEPIIISVNCISMVKDGYKFYLSNNGVWLTNDIPSKYLNI